MTDERSRHWHEFSNPQFLITAKQAYPALEECVLNAEHEVLISLRIFDPHTPLSSAAAMALNFETWAQLLRYKINSGVDVRILLTDFEPVIANQLHEEAWRHSAELHREVPGIEAFPSWHDSEFGSITRVLMWPFVRSRLSKLVTRWNESVNTDTAAAIPGYRHSPGTWAPITKNQLSLRLNWLPPTRMWPATHHQKLIIIDRHSLYIGGLDIDRRRMDDFEHDKPADKTWYDCSMLISGTVANDAAEFFCPLWNKEVTRALKTHTKTFATLAIKAPTLMTDAHARATASAEAARPPRVRLLLTQSVGSGSPVSVGPRSHLTEIKQQVLDWIESARSLIHIETQFLRDRAVGKAILEAARKSPSLGVVIIVPAAPEAIAFGSPNKADRHGDYLQVSILQELIEQLGTRVAVLSLAQKRHGQAESERDTLLGAPIIYLHTKLMVIDQRRAIIGSANLNGRSLHSDTEAAIAIDDEKTVSQMLQALLDHHTGASAANRINISDCVDGMRLATRLNELAIQESQREPNQRESFVLPYPISIARQTCSRVRWMPDRMV